MRSAFSTKREHKSSTAVSVIHVNSDSQVGLSVHSGRTC